MSKQPKLNKLQREAYVYVCRDLWKQKDIKNVSERATSTVLKMNTQELKDLVKTDSPKEMICAKDTNLKKIAKLYSEYELNLLANGKFPISTKIEEEPVIKHHKIGVISDTHIGSTYTFDESIEKAFKIFEDEKCEMVFHCGDLTEGMKSKRLNTQIYEIKSEALGYRKMKYCAINLMKKCKLPIVMISGNHDKFFQDDADIVEDVSKEVSNICYLGYDQAIYDIDGAKIMLFHGSGGYSNTRLNNIAKNFSVYNGDVQICLCGHVHKYEWKYIEKCHMIHVPSIQECTKFMTGKVTYADTGCLILEFDTINKKIQNLKIQYFNFS